MSISPEAMDANLVLTLDEITNLTQDGGKPADTLMNVVALIASRFRTDVCSAYLLEPDRSNLVLAASLGLHSRCIGALRMPLHEGLAGLVAEQVRPVAVDDASRHPRYKYFKESGEEEYHSFLGVPLIDRGILQGVLVVQTKEPRVFRDSEIRMLAEAAEQVAPVVSEARTLDRFVAPAQERLWALARNVWWSWDQDCVNLFRDLNPVRWRELNQNPIALLKEMPLSEIERRATELVLHSRINYVYRRRQEYLQGDRTWGAANAGILRPRPVAYFSAEFGLHESLPIYSGGLGVLSGDHIKSASDLDIPLVGVGLFYGQGYFLQRLDEKGWQREEYLETDINQLPMQPAIGLDGAARRRRNCHPRRRHSRQSLAGKSRPLRSLSPRFQRSRQRSRKTSKPHRASMAATRVRASARSFCSASADFALSRPWAFRPAFFISTKVTAVSPYLKPSAPAWKKKASTSMPPPARFRAKSSSPPTPLFPPATIASAPSSSKNTSDRCATSSASPRRISWASAGSTQRTMARPSA